MSTIGIFFKKKNKAHILFGNVAICPGNKKKRQRQRKVEVSIASKTDTGMKIYSAQWIVHIPHHRHFQECQ